MNSTLLEFGITLISSSMRTAVYHEKNASARLHYGWPVLRIHPCQSILDYQARKKKEETKKKKKKTSKATFGKFTLMSCGLAYAVMMKLAFIVVM